MSTPDIQNVLVPIDFSEASLNALNTAAVIAKRQHATLRLLHVVNRSLLAPSHLEVLPMALPMFDLLHSESAETVERLIDMLKEKHQLEVHGEVVDGFVASEICKHAKKIEADLIVMGTHGASGFREFFIGTNAYTVVKHALCPVLTVPPNQSWESFSKILFPVRNTFGALEKYEFLRKIIRHNKAMLLVLGLCDRNDENAITGVENDVRQLERKLHEDEVMSITEILKSTERCANEVLETADLNQMDLIVITANLDHDIRNFFMGPYAQQIVNHAKVPVLSIRPPQAPLPLTLQSIRADYGRSLQEALLNPRVALHHPIE